MEELILVDFYDQQIGTATKAQAHHDDLLHRAFSVFIVHDGKMLIQKRAAHKYHTPNLWSNACCSHPRNGETLEEAVHRRLQEELGIDAECRELFSFIYHAPFASDLFEYEYDHVFLADCDAEIKCNPQEASAIRWVELHELAEDVRLHPTRYTPWFIIALPHILTHLLKGEA